MKLGWLVRTVGLLWVFALPDLGRSASPLEQQLWNVLASPSLKGARVGVLIVDLDSGKRLFEHRATSKFVPASNQKILVTMAALSTWAPEHRFSTRLYRRGPIQNGVLEGDLFLVGFGDPSLQTNSLYDLAEALRLQGITRVRGDLVVDDSYFSLPEHAFVGGSEAKVYFAPSSALSLNYNTVSLWVRGAEQMDSKPEVYSETPGDYIQLRPQVRMGRSTQLTASRKILKDANRFFVGGAIEPGERQELVRAITAPTSYCKLAFGAVLAQMGIVVEGSGRVGSLPTDAILLREQPSFPVWKILEDMNKYSNNFLAEQLALQLGVERYGAPGTKAQAVQALQAFVDSQGWTDTTIADGSGLSPGNSTSPNTLVDALRKAYAGPFWPEFYASLPIAGTDGTLKPRLLSPNLVGRVRAKTGTIHAVSCLSGYLFRKDGRRVVFAILINQHQSTLGAMQGIHERMLEILAKAELG